jgi:DNA-directed RNA polymerase specialized sigma24 family protein
MPTDPKDAIRIAVRAAQDCYEAEAAAARTARREAFAKAHQEGLSLRDIGQAVGLHHSRVGQIIEGK